MTKKILFITTSSLSTNPRLVKEVQYFKTKGFEIQIIAFRLGTWSDHKDLELIKKLSVRVHFLTATKGNFIEWLLSSIIQKVCERVSAYIKVLKIVAYASNKRSYQILKLLRKRQWQVDLIMAHNLGALFPAYTLSKESNIPLLFDVEDYHPGEKIVATNREEEKYRREYLFKQILPKVDAITFASPLIKEETERLVNWKFPLTTVINNSFYENEFELLENFNAPSKIRLVWFSQLISHGRGLEEFIRALEEFHQHFELTLIGEIDVQFQAEYLEGKSFIKSISPMSQIELHQSLQHFDIGLALEMNTADRNRQICLTNKIFAYLQSGLYLLATDTEAQKEFLSIHCNHGIVCGQDVRSFKSSLRQLFEEKQSWRSQKESRFIKAKSVAYDKEVVKLQGLVERLIS